MTSLDRAWESLEGLSLGDAFGQAFFRVDQSMVDEQIARREPPPAPWLYTDDTEMSLSVVASLARFGGVDQAFLAQSFAERYDYERGYGPAMHRILARIRAGEDWRTVAGEAFNGQGSFGNGAAMRAAPIGAYFAEDLHVAAQHAAKSAEITHAHPEAVAGAVAVAVAAALAAQARTAVHRPPHAAFLESVVAFTPESEVRRRLQLAQAMDEVQSLQFPASVLGNGIQMSAPDTVPYALWCAAQRLDDFESALWLAVGAGGDRDTIGAIVGGVVAAFVGVANAAPAWRARREALPTWPLK